jgi:DNA polymerase III epsilon subunit family exonuclease
MFNIFISKIKNLFAHKEDFDTVNSLNGLKIDWDKVDKDFIVFDLETTGLKTNKSPVDIIEIAAIKFNKQEFLSNRKITTFYSLVKPHRGGINKSAEKINGISQRMVDNDGRDAETVIKEFIEFAGKHRLVAYNVDFDRWFLQREISHWGIKKQFKYDCAYELSKIVFSRLNNYKLTTVAGSLGLPVKGAHRALHDCFLALGVYLVAQSKIQKPSTEELELEKARKEAVGNLLKPNEQGLFFGKSVYVNGHYGLKNPEKELEKIADAGFKIVRQVGVKTDFLVVVGDSLENLNSANLRKGQEMQSNGHHINIMLYKDFVKVI